MFKPGTDENDVQMSDVLCDFCERVWTEDVPLIEGHRGRTICGRCLSVGYAALVHDAAPTITGGYTCSLCRESDDDRAAMNRAGEPGWHSPLHEEIAACRRCVKQAAVTLERDDAFDWSRPAAAAEA